MKNKGLLFVLAAIAVLCGCKGGRGEDEDASRPVTLTGTWAFTELLSGDSWTLQNVKEVLVFDGEGSYAVRKFTGTYKVVWSEGLILADEADFAQAEGQYGCSHRGLQYVFESLGSEYTLSSESEDCLEFSFRRLRRVTGFRAPEHTELDPDREGYINNSYIEPGNNMVGLIKDSSTGKGIPGVVVSDGYSTVATDANGVYQFAASTTVQAVTRYVFYSTPSAYRVETDNGIPSFYKLVLSVPSTGWLRNDWTLIPLDEPETRWTMVGIGDPQCSSSTEVQRYIDETLADMKDYLPKYRNVYAVTLGDIVHDSNNIWPLMKESMSGVTVSGRVLPFFQVMGNHDHNALVDNAYQSSQLYINYFGPDNYSFNRGDVHVICFDNVLVTGRTTENKVNGWTWNSYNSGMTDTQLEWFKKDLSFVKDKSDKMLIVCVHIPFIDTAFKHRTEIMNYLKQFKEVHVMAGHTHFNRNYIHSAYVCQGGLPVYEHVHGAACGAWWEAKSSVNVTGAPSGYTVFEIDGPSIVNWVMKGTGKAEDHQFRVYDGNQTYTGTKGYNYNWYRTDNTGGSSNIVSKGYDGFRNSFVVEVFDDDTKYVKVELWKDGAKLGDFKHLARSTSSNICCCSWFFNERGKNSTTWNSTASSYWYYPTANPSPSEMTGWTVRMTRTIPSNGRENVYTCSTLTTDYEDFKRK